jgi:hypothetical protein
MKNLLAIFALCIACAPVLPAAEFQFSYIVNPDGNQTVVRAGQTITFPSTRVQETSTVTMIVTNRDLIPGNLNGVAVTGDDFRPSGLPLLPTQLAPEREIRFSMRFTPTAPTQLRGNLTITVDGVSHTFALQGQGQDSIFSYDYAPQGQPVTPVLPTQVIRFPDTEIAGTSRITVRVINRGNVDGRLNRVSITGDDFRLLALPGFPVVVPAGQNLSFTVSFTPQAAGQSNGQLLIEDKSFALAGNGVGSRLEFISRIRNVTTNIGVNDAMVFPNATVGEIVPGQVEIVNNGNATAPISGISISGDAFKVGALPSLPIQLAPGQRTTFTINFQPHALGALSGILAVDSRTFQLRGAGSAPSGLPQITFTDLPTQTSPLQQPAIGVRLAEPYGSEVQGTLTLNFVPDAFSDDPAVQFASGGRTASFRIPAGQTEAIFNPNLKTIAFQTGTVSGVISIGATFQVASVNMTPNPPPLRQLTVPAQAPVIRTVQIGSRSATGFEVVVTGYASSRSVSRIGLAFEAATGQGLQTTNLSVETESAFNAWYQNPSSRNFGSQFSASIFINVNGSADAVGAVTATAGNPLGTSAPVRAELR